MLTRKLVLPLLRLLRVTATTLFAEDRSLDGTGNNVANPAWGGVGSLFDFFTPKENRFQRFGRLDYTGIRLTDNAYADTLSAPARNGTNDPGARSVSNRLSVQPVEASDTKTPKRVRY